jgi:peptidoglycan hydrolase CwlO-like protein
MNNEITDIKVNVSSMNNEIASMNNEITDIKINVSSMNNEINSIKLTLENETNRNIKIIAEGHLDLSRKLDDALKVTSEREMFLIRLNRLENEMRIIR